MNVLRPYNREYTRGRRPKDEEIVSDLRSFCERLKKSGLLCTMKAQK